MKTQSLGKYVEYVRECLSNDKRPHGIFLGAGCPMSVKIGTEPLIPDIFGITEQILAMPKNVSQKIALDSICSHLKEGGQVNLTVEDILNCVRGLMAVVGSSEFRGLNFPSLEELDRNICQSIREIVDKPLPSGNTPYHSVARWVGAMTRGNPVEVFTTNYDLLMEQALEEIHVPYFDGFPGSREPFFNFQAMESDIPRQWACLWKLHGSISWYQNSENRVFRSSSGKGSVSLSIHPSHRKYEESRKMPYLAMMDKLRNFLKQPNSVLVMCGYSFGDSHINDVIEQGIESNSDAAVFALLYDNLEGYSNARKMASQHNGLFALARNGGVVGTREEFWKEGVKGTGTENMESSQFILGDFAEFGNLLNEIIGPDRLGAMMESGNDE